MDIEDVEYRSEELLKINSFVSLTIIGRFTICAIMSYCDNVLKFENGLKIMLLPLILGPPSNVFFQLVLIS